MDKYPYFTDEICINTTKPLIFVHFFILLLQSYYKKVKCGKI